MLLLLVIKAIPVKVFGKWGSTVAQGYGGTRWGREPFFKKVSSPQNSFATPSRFCRFFFSIFPFLFINPYWELSFIQKIPYIGIVRLLAALLFVKYWIFFVFFAEKSCFFEKVLYSIEQFSLMRRGSQTVRQRSAKSRKSVQLRSTPPFFCPDFKKRRFFHISMPFEY